MRILVTGGAGFVGSHLVDALLSLGHDVICLDSFFSGRRENVAHHFDNPRFHLFQHDVRLPMPWGSEKLDRIYHLACPASPDQYQFDPILTLETSVKGTQNMLELARRTGARMLFTSTSEMYGDPLEHPQKETYWGNVNPVGVRSGYDEGKRFGEALCMAYKREFGVKTIIIRIFNTYGPNSSIRDSRVIPQFIQAALQGKPINIHGDGTQTRSFCYVDDLVEGIKKAMDYGQSGPYNLGNTEEYTIQAIAEKIIGATASKSKIKYTARPQDDPRQRKPDLTTTKKDLQWQARVSFDKGLEETVSYYKNIL